MGGCGCKNKGNQQQTTQQQVSQPQQPVKNQTVQESVKKIVEKYYQKR
jgi:DNA-binding protein Fis